MTDRIAEAKQAALEVLLHNMNGPHEGLPRVAGWGYPEPYTRDLMISGLGILVSGNQKLTASLRRVLKTLAGNQTSHGHMPSLVHDPGEAGASDTTPLFLMMLAMYRMATGERDFLEKAARKSLTWMEYQSPCDNVMVGQLPTTDWRDEQWVLGFGLYVNAIVYSYLRLFGRRERADRLRSLMRHFTFPAGGGSRVREGLVVRHKSHYAFWSFKLFSSERFDLLGNSLAILSGVAAASRADAILSWVEERCQAMRQRGELAVNMPPNFFPFVVPGDPEWSARYQMHNRPGEYHNGGVWPFVCGFYVAAAVAAGRTKLARQKLDVLTDLVRPARDQSLKFGFNEYLRAQDGQACGQDWQTWSAAMYLYAAACVERESTPFFDRVRQGTG